MNKGQLTAALLLGATLGAGGKALVENTVSTAIAAPAAPFAHAVDLRRDFSGSNFTFTAYANRALDAGYTDLGQAKKCQQLNDTAKKKMLDCMNAAGAACEW